MNATHQHCFILLAGYGPAQPKIVGQDSNAETTILRNGAWCFVSRGGIAKYFLARFQFGTGEHLAPCS